MNEPENDSREREINTPELPQPTLAVWVATSIILLIPCWLGAGMVVGMLAKDLRMAELDEVGRWFFLPVRLADADLGAFIVLGIGVLLASAQLWAVIGRSSVVSFLIGWSCLSLVLLFVLLTLWALVMIVAAMPGADDPKTFRNPWPWLVPIILGFIGVTMLRWRNQIRLVSRRLSSAA